MNWVVLISDHVLVPPQDTIHSFPGGSNELAVTFTGANASHWITLKSQLLTLKSLLEVPVNFLARRACAMVSSGYQVLLLSI